MVEDVMAPLFTFLMVIAIVAVIGLAGQVMINRSDEKKDRHYWDKERTAAENFIDMQLRQDKKDYAEFERRSDERARLKKQYGWSDDSGV